VYRLICGVDEAGRGPLAGPVVAAAAILPPNHGINGIRDSKKLSPRRREELAGLIRERSVAWSVAFSSPFEIDQLNIFQATLLAMRRAVEGLSVSPSEVLVDGTHCPEWSIPSRAIVKGDSLIEVISAASILAKTARDHEMLKLHHTYPQYRFDKHKGYPTPEHLELLRKHGPCEIYRQSFGPVQRASLHRS